jgi:hypothetical protein
MKQLTHKFVEYMPESLDEGVVYVSIPFSLVSHKCCCGCGEEVVTPLSPTDWELIFDGDTVSLYPSIGNWNFKCRSHYWIRRNRVEWAPQWSGEQIKAVRYLDSLAKDRYFRRVEEKVSVVEPSPKSSVAKRKRKGILPDFRREKD